MTAIPASLPDPDAEFYTPKEVGALFHVDPYTVSRWDRTGKFPEDQVTRTLGGHRRFNGDYIRSLLAGDSR